MILTAFVAKPASPATPRVLNSSEPMTVPKPMSESAIKVLIVLVKNSGIVEAIAINVAAATSCKVRRIHICKKLKLSLNDFMIKTDPKLS